MTAGAGVSSPREQLTLDRPSAAPTVSLAELARADGVRFLLATFVDLHGKMCSKLVPVSAADELQSDGVGFAGYAAGAMGQTPADPDLVALPDIASYAQMPFVREGLAMVQCDVHVLGEPWPYSPRVLLKEQVARAAAAGVELFAGAEIEYFLVARGPDGVLRPADLLDAAAQPCYDSRGLTRMYDHLTAVADAMNGLGWGNYASDHEDGNGQFEQNFRYADVLTTADRVVAARYLISVLAEQRGMTATFMPKPFADRTGSGLHLHLSLWRDGAPLFPGEDARGLGLSPMAYAFVGGVLDHAPGLHALLAPTVNSYKRTGAVSTASGATWAPRQATYGGNDRTHYLRVPDGDRVELRAGDGAANPYLAAAGTLAAGLDGISRDLDPGDPSGPGAVPPGAKPLPLTLLAAVEAFEADPAMTAVLNATGGGRDVAAYYAGGKREEFFAWHSAVSPWELDRYLTA